MKKGIIYLVSFLICFWAVFPFYWTIVTSLRAGSELFNNNIIPTKIEFLNYISIFTEQSFGMNLLNSIIIACFTVTISIILSSCAAYPLSREKFMGRKAILISFLFVSMFPQIAILSGLFELIRIFHLFNHRSALILSYLVFTLPFTVWTLTVFMKALPKGVEEAALMDGAGLFILIFRILLPMMTPSLITTSLLGFITAWNEFLFALTFTLTEKSRTVPVAIAMMSGASEYEIPWGRIMAASVVVTIPIIALVIIFQRRIVAGLTAGSVKG